MSDRKPIDPDVKRRLENEFICFAELVLGADINNRERAARRTYKTIYGPIAACGVRFWPQDAR